MSVRGARPMLALSIANAGRGAVDDVLHKDERLRFETLSRQSQFTVDPARSSPELADPGNAVAPVNRCPFRESNPVNRLRRPAPHRAARGIASRCRDGEAYLIRSSTSRLIERIGTIHLPIPMLSCEGWRAPWEGTNMLTSLRAVKAQSIHLTQRTPGHMLSACEKPEYAEPVRLLMIGLRVRL